MDEYANFVEASLRASNPARAARQKELEERIMTPFRIVDGKDGKNCGLFVRKTSPGFGKGNIR